MLGGWSWIGEGEEVFRGRGKNGLKKGYIEKGMGLMKWEEEVVCVKIGDGEELGEGGEGRLKWEVDIMGKWKGLGIIGLGEIVIGVFLRKEVFEGKGKGGELIEIGDGFEKVFNWSLGSM